MKIWIGGEINSEVGDSFRKTRNCVEKFINELLSTKDYGDKMLNWDITIMVLKDKVKDSFKYNKRNRETDFKIALDIHVFESADDLQKKYLLFDLIISSISKLRELVSGDIKYDDLKRDIESLKFKL